MESVFPAARNVADMPPRSLALLVLAAGLAVAGVAAGVGGPPSPVADTADRGLQSQAAAPASSEAIATHTPVPGGTATPTPNRTRGPATVTMRLQLQADGDARWFVSTTVPIHDEADAAAFDELAEDFADGEVSMGLETFQLALDNASAATGRSMELRNVQRSSSQTDTEGTLTLAFTWANFARTEGDRLYVGDAFNSTDGTWLPRLTEHQTLVIVPPSEYGVVSAPQVGIVDGAARWEGPHEFDGREPWIVYSGDAQTSTTVTSTPPPTTPTTPTPTPTVTATPTLTDTPGGGGLGSVVPVALLVVVAGASAAALVVYMRGDGGPDPGSGSTAAGTGDDPGGVADDGGATTSTADTAGPAAAETTVDLESGDAADPDGAAAAGAGVAEATDDEGEGEDDVDVELLSDEERVERLLDQNGGRMKQANIVKETGWSNAKVSQLLSSMADEGRIDKLRIGRENLISFPDEDVTEIGSDDE
jgi:hypothetical protein